MNDIIKEITVGDKPYLGIEIGDDKTGVPKNILQGMRMSGIIVDDHELTPWAWNGVTSVDDRVYVYFDKCNIEGLETISTTNRENALMLIKEIAYGILSADKEFISLEGNVFPLYRIFILDKTKILLLPPDLGNILAISRIGEKRRDEVGNLVKENTLHSFQLILEMVELMYYAATGLFPYSLHEVRSNHFQEIPLDFFNTGLDISTEAFINLILHAGNRKTRDISGNRKAQENLGYFLQEASKLEWNLQSITEEEKDDKVKEVEDSPEFQTFMEKSSKIAKKRDFWRVKGTLITAAAAIAIIIIAVFSSILYNSLKPPVTKDMDQKAMLLHFYESQNNLDSTEMEAGVKCDIPQATEVMNLFVTRQTRMAYENSNPQINAVDWVNNGKDAIPETSYVYGTVIDRIEIIGDDEWKVTATWYTPYPYEKEKEDADDKIEGKVAVYSYEVTETFHFKWNKRGWWNIDNIEITGYKFLNLEYADTYKKEASTLFIAP